MSTPIAEGEPISTIDNFLVAFDETDDDLIEDLALHLGLDQQIDTDPISNLFPIPSDLTFTQFVGEGDLEMVHSTAAESS